MWPFKKKRYVWVKIGTKGDVHKSEVFDTPFGPAFEYGCTKYILDADGTVKGSTYFTNWKMEAA